MKKDIYIYRITHIDNISHILQKGITKKNSPKANPDYKNIGDQSLIDIRSTKKVIINNGISGNLNLSKIILGDYIPFYFGVKMPMLYVIQHGGNFVEKATKPEDIIYLVCSLDDILISNNTYYFTDGHATDNFTTFYDKNKINELEEIICWESVRSNYWSGDENLDMKRKKQAEFLLLNDIKPNLIFGFVCYNEEVEQKLITMGIDKTKIKIHPNSYY